MNDYEEDYRKIEEIVDGILKHLAFLQYYPPDSVGLRGKLLFYAMVHITAQPALAMYENWALWDFNLRVAAIDNLILSLGILSLSVDVFLMSERFGTLINLTNSKYKLYSIGLRTGDSVLSGKRLLVRKTTSEGCGRAGMIANVLYYFFISFTLIPLSSFASYLLRLKSVENLSLPFLLYSPVSFSLKATSFTEFILLTLIELFYVYCAAILAKSIQILQFLSVNNVLGEMRLFQLNAKEIDDLYDNLLMNAATHFDRKTLEADLRSATRKLVSHHQTIFRKVKQLNHASNIRILFVNSYICFQIVFGIFIFLKGEFILKIKYGLIVITVTMTGYIFSENGQRLQDEGEELKMALYGCGWIGKPSWFTRTLQILMIRTSHLPKVGLLNVFTLNRNNVTVVIRGAYSYFSLLNNLSS